MENEEQLPCSGLTEIFFDENPETITESEQLAKSICETCPFREACLQQGMNEEFGVWGGKTARERRSIKRKQRKNTTTES